MEERENGKHTKIKEILRGCLHSLVFPGLFVLTHSSSSRSFHHWGIPVLSLTKFNSRIPCFLPFQTTLWSQE